MSIFAYPSELLDAICSHIYDAGTPPAQSSLDPLVTTVVGVPVAQPSSSPQPHWPEPLVRRTLASLCLVNHTWFEAAKPWLWRRYVVSLPESSILFLPLPFILALKSVFRAHGSPS